MESRTSLEIIARMGKSLNAPQSIGISKGRLKHKGAFQRFHQPTLPGDPKFPGKFAFGWSSKVPGVRCFVCRGPT